MAFRSRRRRNKLPRDSHAHAGRTGKRGGPARRRRVGLEALEDRSMLSITLNWTGPFHLSPNANVDAMNRAFNQQEAMISADPTQPGTVVATANTSENNLEAVAVSQTAGATWVRNDIGMAQDGLTDGGLSTGRFDGNSVVDQFGNIHMVYLHDSGTLGGSDLVYAISSDHGLTWQTRVLLTDDFTVDKPWITVGPDAANLNNDAVWITYSAIDALLNQNIYIRGASVAGPGIANVGPFSPEAQVSDEFHAPANYAVPAVGPDGQVTVTWQDNPSINTENQVRILVARAPNGLIGGIPVFSPDTIVTTSNAGSFDFNFATPRRGYFASPYIVYDQTRNDPANPPLRYGVVNGKFGVAGRLYMVYTDEPIDESNNNVIFERYSDDDGVTWSPAVRVDDTGGLGVESRFFANASVDQSTGALDVGWYDDRLSPTNSSVVYFATASVNGGLSFLPNVRVGAGPSNSGLMGSQDDFGDYTGISAVGGSFYSDWSDNFLNGRPDGDVVVARTALLAQSQVVTFNPSAGNNTYIVRLDPSGQFVQFYDNIPAGSGLPTYTATLTALSKIIVDGGAGDDTLIVDMSNGNPIPVGGISYDGGAGTDTIQVTADTNFTLTNPALILSGKITGTIALTNVEAAVLGGGAGLNTFNISGWTSTAPGSSISGNGGIDTIIGNFPTSVGANITFSDTQLTVAGISQFNLAGISILNLTGGTGNETFTDNGFTGIGGTLSTGLGVGTLNVNIDADITITNTQLIAGPAVFALSGFNAANLTGGPGGHVFTITGWTGPVNSIDGGGGADTIVDRADANFTLSSTKLSVSNGVVWNLSNVAATSVILSGGPGNNTFDVSGWVSTGTNSALIGNGGKDTIIANFATTSNVNFTFSNTSLVISPLASFAISGISVLNLTAGGGNNTFTDNGFTGLGGTLASVGAGTLVVNIDANITLSNTQLIAGPATFAIAGFTVAKLTGGPSNNVFDVSGWSSAAAGSSITGGGGTDTLVAIIPTASNANFTFSNTSLTISGVSSFALGNILKLVLSGGTGAEIFTDNGFTGIGTSLSAGTGNGTLAVNIDANITLTDTQLIAGPATFAISGFHAANLTGGPSNNTFLLTGWTGAGNTLNGGGGADTIILAADADFTLSNTMLKLSTGVNWALSNVANANALLTGGGSANTFTVPAWNGRATLAGGDGNDNFLLGAGNLDQLTGRIVISGGNGADQLTLDDSTISNPYNYDVTPTLVAADPTTPRPWGGVTIDGSLENLTLTATTGNNSLFVTPSTATTYTLNGNLPVPGTPVGDYLAVQFFGTTGRQLIPTVPGSGSWTFTDNHKPVIFTSIEKVNNPASVPFAVGADAGVGSQPLVQVRDGLSGEVLNSFLAYAATYTGGVRVAMADMNGDGTPDIITAPGRSTAPIVKVFNGKTGTLIGQFLAYGSGYNGGVEVAAGDIDGDGKNEIVVAPDRGLSTIRIFRGPSKSFALVGSFNAFETSFIGGATVAVADTTGDNKAEIIVGSGSGRQSEVRVFNALSHRLINDIFPFDPSYRGGVFVGVGDVNGDGKPDIIVSQSTSGTALVRAFNGKGNAILTTFATFDNPPNAPVHFIARDASSIGRVQLYAAQGTDGHNHELRVFDTLAGTEIGALSITDTALLGGVRMG